MHSGNLLSDKCILVTGGSRGLGRALCDEFSAQGANVAFNYSSDDAGAEESLGIIEGNGRKGLSYKVSVLDSSGLNDMV